MRSSKLEDSIYAELREDDPEMDMTENAAVQKLKSFPALSRDVFQSLYSLAPRRNDVDILTAAAQKFNAPLLDHISQQDDYPTLKISARAAAYPPMKRRRSLLAEPPKSWTDCCLNWVVIKVR